MEKAEENDAFQQEMKQSHKNARLMNDRLQNTIDSYNPIHTKFANFIVAIREQRASLWKEITAIKQQYVQINQRELDDRVQEAMEKAEEHCLGYIRTLIGSVKHKITLLKNST